MELGCQQIDILGGTGSRIDHVIANIQVLAIPYEAGCRAQIIDGVNRISIVEKDAHYQRHEMYGSYFSLFTLGGQVTGLTVRGCKYPLENHSLVPYDSLSVSNQVTEEVLEITYKDGILILIEAGDE